MNLSNEEAQEINRRVAVAMGWVPATRQDGTIWGDGSWWVIGDTTKCPPHQNFCRDAAAADLVRQEIARKWDYQEGRWGTSLYHCHITGDQQGRDEWGAEHEYLFMARCLAFLAAHEAKAEEEGGEE